jgi:membrane protein DedA with SNARE-associated domain/rhodanese-related sulfurtransferase
MHNAMHEAMEFLLKHGYIVIFAAVLIEQIGLPAPAGPILIAAGALAGLHKLSLPAVMALALVACLICDSLWFCLGRRRGVSVVEFVCRIALEPNVCISKTHSAYTRYGAKSLLISKFVPWLGTLGPPMAGMFNLAPWKFVLLDGTGAFAWASVYVVAGWLFRTQLEDLAFALSRFGVLVAILVALGLGTYIGSKYVRRRHIYRTLRADRIGPRELKQRMDAGEEFVIVDLRADFERVEGIIPGAIAVTYEQIDSLPAAISQKDVILYCSCPREITSVRAALRLKRHGATRVHPLLGGFAEWRDLGFPVDVPKHDPVSSTP